MQYLEYVISENGISASPDKVAAVREYPIPKTVRDIRDFLGLASFYGRLVSGFTEVAKTLTEMTRKDRQFDWGPYRQESFEKPKELLCSEQVFEYPNFEMHGREMVLPSTHNLRAKISRDVMDFNEASRLESLKASLRLAYRAARGSSRMSQQNNKRLYDWKATFRKFEVGDSVYLYNPAMKPGRCRKFHKTWTWPFKITRNLSDFNYEVMSIGNKKFLVHVNRLKRAYNTAAWKPKCEGRTLRKKSRIKDATGEEGVQSDEDKTLIQVAPRLTVSPPDEQVPSPTQ